MPVASALFRKTLHAPMRTASPAAPPPPPVLQAVGVLKQFGHHSHPQVVIDRMSFSIPEGSLFGLIGVSGAGKTTLLRLLIGYYTPDEGRILYKGTDITHNMQEIRSVFGFATQDNCFYDELCVEDNLRYFGKMYGLSSKAIDERTTTLLNLVGLSESRSKKASQLSGGMQRRLDLAISLIHNPEILILDEPTTGLDPMMRKKMWELIKDINALGVTIIISSHLLDEMEYLCTQVAIIKDGKLLIEGSPDQLKTYYSRNQEVRIESRPGNYAKVLGELRKRGVATMNPRMDEGRLVFYTPDLYQVMRVLPTALIGINELLMEIQIDKPRLEEVFEALTAVRR